PACPLNTGPSSYWLLIFYWHCFPPCSCSTASWSLSTTGTAMLGRVTIGHVVTCFSGHQKRSGSASTRTFYFSRGFLRRLLGHAEASHAYGRFDGCVSFCSRGLLDCSSLSVFCDKPSNQSMKPTAPFRCNFGELATTPCVGLSLSR